MLKTTMYKIYLQELKAFFMLPVIYLTQYDTSTGPIWQALLCSLEKFCFDLDIYEVINNKLSFQNVWKVIVNAQNLH